MYIVINPEKRLNKPVLRRLNEVEYDQINRHFSNLKHFITKTDMQNADSLCKMY